MMSKSKKSLAPPKLFLDYVDQVSWNDKIKVFLIDIQNWTLHRLQQQVKRDGSSSPEVLAGLRIIRHVLPCPVEIYPMDTFYTLRFRLGKGSFEYKKGNLSTELIEKLMGANLEWHETFNPSNQEVLMVIQKGEPFEEYFHGSMLEKAIDYMTRIEQEQLVLLRQQVLNDIEYRPIEIRVPSEDQDIRIQYVARMTDKQIATLSGSDLVSDMQRISKLITICPENIEQVMQRARLLYVHTYHEWEFSTMSVHYAVLALEASLRTLYDEWLGTEDFEVLAEVQEIQIVEIMSGPRENILKWAKRKDAKNVKAKGALLPRNKSQLLDHAVRIGVLSFWERERSAHLLYLRDIFSHPTDAFTEWIGWATNNIIESCLLINLMWARFYKTMPYEFAWEKKPNYLETTIECDG